MRQNKKQIMQRLQQEDPLPAIETLRRNLAYRLVKGITPERMDRIADALGKKAEEGDLKAIKIVAEITQASGGSQSGTTHMQQAILYQQSPNGRTISDLRNAIVQHLDKFGAMHIEDLADAFSEDRSAIIDALDHLQWFVASDRGYSITPQARKEVLQKLPDPKSRSRIA